MTYIKATRTSRWWTGGESASAECLQRDECDFETGYSTLRKINLEAEHHALQTGHSVQVERAQFRVIEPVLHGDADVRPLSCCGSSEGHAVGCETLRD